MSLASVSGGYLSLQGDSNADNIAINGTTTAGQFVIQGLNHTTINGWTSVIVKGAGQGITVDFLNGADQLAIGATTAVTILQDLDVTAAGANSSVLVVGSKIGGSVNITMGNGASNSVAIEGGTVAGGVNVFLGDGANDVVFVGSGVSATQPQTNFYGGYCGGGSSGYNAAPVSSALVVTQDMNIGVGNGAGDVINVAAGVTAQDLNINTGDGKADQVGVGSAGTMAQKA